MLPGKLITWARSLDLSIWCEFEMRLKLFFFAAFIVLAMCSIRVSKAILQKLSTTAGIKR